KKKKDAGNATNQNGYANNANDTQLKLKGEEYILGKKRAQRVEGEDANEEGIPEENRQMLKNRTEEHWPGSVELSYTTV
ncbi:hypothetical protein CSC81_16745, partial [Tenacibaculum discolor]